jgi:hypothetical protein
MVVALSRAFSAEPRHRRRHARVGLEPIAARLTKELIMERCRAMRAANARMRARMAHVREAYSAQQRRLGLTLNACSDRTIH